MRMLLNLISSYLKLRYKNIKINVNRRKYIIKNYVGVSVCIYYMTVCDDTKKIWMEFELSFNVGHRSK